MYSNDSFPNSFITLQMGNKIYHIEYVFKCNLICANSEFEFNVSKKYRINLTEKVKVVLVAKVSKLTLVYYKKKHV